MIEFTIYHEVAPKQGDRVRVIRPKNGGAPFATHYTPAKVKNNSFSLAALMQSHRPPAPLEGPLRLELTFDYPWRVGEPQKNRGNGARPKDTKPDFDNLCKNVLDTMQDSGFYVNDSQIADIRVIKQWTGQFALTVKMEAIP